MLMKHLLRLVKCYKKDYDLNTTKHFYRDASVFIRDFHLHAEPHVYERFLATSHLYHGKNRKNN